MNSPQTPASIEDVQSSRDVRNIPISKVGIKSIRHPLNIIDKQGVAQPTVASVDMYVYLPAEFKGTHMSRFVQILNDRSEPISVANFEPLLRGMLEKLEADTGYIELRFPYFVRKAAPVSGVQSLMDYEVSLIGEVRKGVYEQKVRVLVPTTSLCPCSKKISEYGAHNQRSHVTVTATLGQSVWIDDLIRLVEDEASCELFGLLKRPDEKYVTERAYDNPKFVEDMIRDVAVRLNAVTAIDAYVLEVENFESIHNHSAYALIEHDKRTA
ncbi:GTP cyclohydrolase FolE2 [Chitinimonas sp. BJYL2]|uniref:GTP cyclohydrolase FolE2 n=1 Tax=Chitinimonas sp. BJYL2 TaxID=2976696 RepID=UPI0022B5DCD5|nr:GTP cyclohydrolase FolE2 [Chitinimonas sp. BJYL2]